MYNPTMQGVAFIDAKWMQNEQSWDTNQWYRKITMIENQLILQLHPLLFRFSVTALLFYYINFISWYYISNGFISEPKWPGFTQHYPQDNLQTYDVLNTVRAQRLRQRIAVKRLHSYEKACSPNDCSDETQRRNKTDIWPRSCLQMFLLI